MISSSTIETYPATGQGCTIRDRLFTPDGPPFIIPNPDVDRWLHVELVEEVLRDRWIGAGIGRPKTLPRNSSGDRQIPRYARRTSAFAATSAAAPDNTTRPVCST